MSTSGQQNEPTRNSTNLPAKRKRDSNHGLGWLPWVALLLLLLLLGLMWLMSSLSDDEGESTTTSTAAPATTAAPAEQQSANGTARTNEGSDLFSLASNNDLAMAAGQQATLQDVRVQSVVANEAFWVGNGDSQFFVHLSSQAREGGESAPRVTEGAQVNASGQIVRAIQSPQTLGVTSTEGAEQLRNQGAYLEATSFSLR